MTWLLTWRYCVAYARRPLNVILLAVVPVIFVSLAAGAIADFARILGGTAGRGQLEVVTAGWAAAFMAGVAGFFHVNGAREADLRLAAAQSSPSHVVGARLLSSLMLAAVATGGALLALFVRTDITNAPRVVGATAMFALIYIAIGTIIGVLVRSEVNGSLLVIFVWMFDVFLGPAMGQSDSLVTRFFPTHFPTLVMLDSGTTHADPLGDLGAASAWSVGALVVAFVVLARLTRPLNGEKPATADHSQPPRMGTGLRFAWRDYRRNVALWVLLAGLPVFSSPCRSR